MAKIKCLYDKARNEVKYNFESIVTNEDGTTTDILPVDFTVLKQMVLDTVAWLAGRKVAASFDDGNAPIMKIKAAAEKTSALIIKYLDKIKVAANLTIDETTEFTRNEQAILAHYRDLISINYTDSELNSVNMASVKDAVTWHNDQVSTINGYTTRDELISYLSNMRW